MCVHIVVWEALMWETWRPVSPDCFWKGHRSLGLNDYCWITKCPVFCGWLEGRHFYFLWASNAPSEILPPLGSLQGQGQWAGWVPATLKAPASFSPPPENHHTPDPWGQQSSLASQLLFLRREGDGAQERLPVSHPFFPVRLCEMGLRCGWPVTATHPIPHSSSEPERTSDPQLIHNIGKHERKPVPIQLQAGPMKLGPLWNNP